MARTEEKVVIDCTIVKITAKAWLIRLDTGGEEWVAKSLVKGKFSMGEETSMEVPLWLAEKWQ